LQPIATDHQLLDLVLADEVGHFLEGDLLRAAETAAEPQLQPQNDGKYR